LRAACWSFQERRPDGFFTMVAMTITDVVTDTTHPIHLPIHVPGTTELDPEFRLAGVDLYRDIHKGIRAELFAVTSSAGNIDPADCGDRRALASHLEQMAWVLESHARHEDAHVEPLLREHLPALAERVEADHAELEARFAWIVALAVDLVDAPVAQQRGGLHLLYLELSGFTSRYLRHQLVEEGEIMPELDRLLGPDQCGALHGAIVGSIPPDEMARFLAFMLPAMNSFDRLEMLTGIRMSAPPEAFDGVVGLARSVLPPRDFQLLTTALGLG
jgi:hypothetical protein